MRRPARSPSQPEQTAPTSRIHSVIVNTAVTAVSGTPNSCEIGTMISRKIVKSKESKVQPSQAATQAYHWSLVGSFHHGMVLTVSTAAIGFPPLFLRDVVRIISLPFRPAGSLRRPPDPE